MGFLTGFMSLSRNCRINLYNHASKIPLSSCGTYFEVAGILMNHSTQRRNVQQSILFQLKFLQLSAQIVTRLTIVSYTGF